MTLREKQVVSAYTMVLMCSMPELYSYVEELLGRPVYTHELADEQTVKEIKEKAKTEFLEICSK